jgi:hypothetical protein
MELYKVYDGEYWYIAATSEEEARRIAKEDYSIDEDDQGIEVEQVSRDVVFPVFLEDYDPKHAIHDNNPVDPVKDERGRWICTATVEQWLSNAEIGDMIASSIY